MDGPLSDLGDEEQNGANEEGIVIDDYDDFDDEEVDNEKGHNKKKSSTVLSTAGLRAFFRENATGAQNRISTETTNEFPNRSQKASAKPDVYQEDVTKIRFPASKSSSSTKPPSVKTTLSERIRFPDKPTRTSPVKISIPSETPETSVTAGKGTA